MKLRDKFENTLITAITHEKRCADYASADSTVAAQFQMKQQIRSLRKKSTQADPAALEGP